MDLWDNCIFYIYLPANEWLKFNVSVGTYTIHGSYIIIMLVSFQLEVYVLLLRHSCS